MKTPSFLNPLPYLKNILLFISLFLIIGQASTQNFVTTYAGTGSPGFVNGDTSIASFNKPFGICIDEEGNLFLADAYNHCIRKIGIDGEVSIYAGTGTAGYLNGPADEAKFNQPLNICFDGNGNMFVSDFINQRIRKISADMEVTTIAGTGSAGLLNGPAMEAKFNYPRGICLDDTGNIYIGDSWNHRIRKISVDGIVSDWAGGGTTIGVQSIGDFVDASDTAARFYTPCELSIDQYNNIFVADAYNHRIRKIDANRMVSTIAGSGESGPDGGGFQNGFADTTRFNVPTACHVTIDGTVFVGDGSNQRVRKIGTDDMVSTFAGSGETGFEDGADSLATFNFPRGTVVDYNMNRLYVVDYNNHAIRAIHYELITRINIDLKKNFAIFPNPSSGFITIQFSELPFKAHLKIYNSTGQLIKQLDELSFEKVQIDLSDSGPGIYYLYLMKNGQHIADEKIIVI